MRLSGGRGRGEGTGPLRYDMSEVADEVGGSSAMGLTFVIGGGCQPTLSLYRFIPRRLCPTELGTQTQGLQVNTKGITTQNTIPVDPKTHPQLCTP